MKRSSRIARAAGLGYGAARGLLRARDVAALISAACVGGAMGQGTMYASDSSRAFYSVNMSTGAKTLLGSISANVSVPASMAFACDTGTVYVANTLANFGVSRQVYTLNVATRQATAVGPFGDAAILMHGMEYDVSTGTLYGISSHNGGFYQISRTNGAATLIGLTGIEGLGSFGNLVYYPPADTLFASNALTDSLYTINRATGVATLVGPFNGPVGIGGMTYNQDNGLLYLTDNDGDILYNVDPSTGGATPIGPTGTGNLIGLVYVPVAGTPCPPTLPPIVCNDVDFNNDGSFFDPQDIDALLSVYAEGDCIPSEATCDDIDFNNDTSIFDPCDIDAFLLVFSEGPCTACGV